MIKNRYDAIGEFCRYSSVIIIPIILSIIVYSQTEISLPLFLRWILIFLSFVLGGLCELYAFRTYLAYGGWKRWFRKKLKKPLIGIIREEGCPSPKTRFTPEKWGEFLEDKYKTKFLSSLNINEISDKFIVIINPYGECYPEKNIHEKTSFKRIKEYVENGGIFVSTAGLAFWYSWNKRSIGAPSTAKEVQLYGGISKPIMIVKLKQDRQHLRSTINSVEMDTRYSLKPLQSLTETLTFDELGMLSTTGVPRLIRVSQKDDDIDKFGDIQKAGRTNLIFEFRAIRKPVQSCISILRSEIPTDDKPLDIYPLACVPHGSGMFIFTGMHMNIQPNDDIIKIEKKPDNTFIKTQIKGNSIRAQTRSWIINAQAKKVCKALENIIENL